MTITTVAIVTTTPGSGDEAEKALIGLGESTHAEQGCVHYSHVHRGLDDPDTFVTVEKWESKEALDQHLVSDHLARAVEAASQYFAGPPNIIPLTQVALPDNPKGVF